MNTFTHFFTGYLVGRYGFKQKEIKNDHFICFFASIAAILPDLDSFMHLLFPIKPLEHAVFTHTLIGAYFLAFIYASIIWIVGKNFLKELEIKYKSLILIAILAITSHLILDIFTYRENIYTTDAHLYFWPIWNASFHLNYFFHQSQYPNIYTVRIIIEIIYSSILAGIIFIYGWIEKKENPFLMISPTHWLNYLPDNIEKQDYKKISYILLIINLVILCILAIGSLD
ncbi:MAG: metal-dependent hydrolase [Promethearchaeota archaeon]